MEGSAWLLGSSWAKVCWKRSPLSPSNWSALVFLSYSITGRSSLWEVWSQCKHGDGFQSAATGALSQLRILTAALSPLQNHTAGVGDRQLLERRGRFFWTDKTIMSSTLSVVKILLPHLSKPTLSFHSHNSCHPPYFIILFLDYQRFF